MNRRELIVGLGAAAWPVVARAQHGERMRRLGVLMARPESDPVFQAHIQIFRTRLQQLGWTDGDNLRIDYRWTAGIADRFRTAAIEIVNLKPDVILADATPSVAALWRETRTIPIVFVAVTDPVAQGFVASLAHPLLASGSNFCAVSSPASGAWRSWVMSAFPPLCWELARLTQRRARSASRSSHSKSGTPRILRPPSRRSRAGPKRFMSVLTRSQRPTASASTPWLSPRNCRQ
jgi:putative tryptophan/tyrosine transport system substrate-binding protein